MAGEPRAASMEALELLVVGGSTIVLLLLVLIVPKPRLGFGWA